MRVHIRGSLPLHTVTKSIHSIPSTVNFYGISSFRIPLSPYSKNRSSIRTIATDSEIPTVPSSSFASILSNTDQDLLRTLTAPVTSIRLDNLLNQHGICGRRDTRQYCRQNKVTGIPTSSSSRSTTTVITVLPSSSSNFPKTNESTKKKKKEGEESMDPSKSILLQSGSIHVIPSTVRINNEAIPYAGVPLHLALYKPPNYVVSHSIQENSITTIDPDRTMNDTNNDTVPIRTGNIYELLPPEFLLRNPMLSAIGRLDKFASGLLLFTTNGKLNERLTHPIYHVPKTYIVEVDRPLGSDTYSIDEIKSIFEQGKILLPDYRYASPAFFQPHRQNTCICKLTLYEGRYHQIRRMFGSLGYTVKNIHRIGIGKLSLSSLGLKKESEWKLLSKEELASLLYSSSSYGKETFKNRVSTTTTI